jgi:hypothetical protein
MNNNTHGKGRPGRGTIIRNAVAVIAAAGLASGCVSAPPPPPPEPMDFGSLAIERAELTAGGEALAAVERDMGAAAGEGAKEGAVGGGAGMFVECSPLLLAGPVGLAICGTLAGVGAVVGAGIGAVAGAMEEGTSDDPEDVALIQARLEEVTVDPEPALREGFLAAAKESEDTVDDRLVAPMADEDDTATARTLLVLEIDDVGFYRAPHADRQIGIQLVATARFIDRATGDEKLVLHQVLQGRTHLLMSWTGNDGELVGEEFRALVGQVAEDLLHTAAGMQAEADRAGDTGAMVAAVDEL